MMCANIWKIGIPKDTLIAILEKLDADEDGFVSIGEVRDVLKRYVKDARSNLKSSIMRRSS